MVDSEKVVSQLLADFLVGTEQAKPPPAPPEADTVFKPLRQYWFQNPSQKMIDQACGMHSEAKSDAVHGSLEQEYDPNYEHIYLAQGMLYGFLKTHDDATQILNQQSKAGTLDCIGNKLTRLRACDSDSTCNGDIGKMTQTVSKLTWYEEWFMYFEFVWGRTMSTLEATKATFEIKNHDKPSNIIGSKLKLILAARRSWPMYASMQEDEKLHDSKWDAKYKNKHPIFWDNTGLHLHKPTESLLQRLTFSAYYAGNVGKGGIFVQLCGWLGTHELYPGAMSDTDYLNKTGILEMQRLFQDQDGGTRFLNVLDRGYRATRAAWQHVDSSIYWQIASGDQVVWGEEEIGTYISP